MSYFNIKQQSLVLVTFELLLVLNTFWAEDECDCEVTWFKKDRTFGEHIYVIIRILYIRKERLKHVTY